MMLLLSCSCFCQFSQAHGAALDQLREKQEGVNLPDSENEMRTKSITFPQTVCRLSLCEAVSAVLSDGNLICCSGACQTLTLTML